MSARGNSGMEHGAPADKRLQAFASFDTRLGGHVAVMLLLKRYDFLDRRVEPLGVEYDWTNRYAVLWDRLARTALELVGPLPMMEANRQQLWRMAKSVVAGIDNKKMDGRCEWYPDRWAEIAVLIRADRRVVLSSQPAEPARPVSPWGALNALDIAATGLAIPEAQVLEGAGLKRPLGEGAELAIMEWYEERKRDADHREASRGF